MNREDLPILSQLMNEVGEKSKKKMDEIQEPEHNK